MTSGPRLVVAIAWVASLLDPVARLDQDLQVRVQALRTPWLDPVMQAASDLGRHEVVLGALLGIAVFSGAPGPATAREALAVLLPVNLAVEGLKRATNRARPDGEHRRDNASFPSSHAANAFAMAFVLARRWRRLGPAFFAGAVWIAASRVYLNRHFMSDVLVAAILGVGLAWLVVGWLRGRRDSRPPHAGGEVAPTV